MFGRWLARIFKPREVEIPSGLEEALQERRDLIDEKNKVLLRFRKAHDALSDRRRSNKGHDPERRSARGGI